MLKKILLFLIKLCWIFQIVKICEHLNFRPNRVYLLIWGTNVVTITSNLFAIFYLTGINSPPRDYGIPGTKVSRIFTTVGTAGNLVFAFNTGMIPEIQVSLHFHVIDWDMDDFTWLGPFLHHDSRCYSLSRIHHYKNFCNPPFTVPYKVLISL